MRKSPVSKIYEALSALADGRVSEKDSSHFQVTSSDRSKAYTVVFEENIITSNDNATVFQHYAGYPILAVLLFLGKLSLDASLLPFFRGIPWKVLNTKYKNKYDLSIQEAFGNDSEETKKRLFIEGERLLDAEATLPYDVKGNRRKLILLNEKAKENG
jgi:hypothetical protein